MRATTESAPPRLRRRCLAAALLGWIASPLVGAAAALAEEVVVPRLVDTLAQVVPARMSADGVPGAVVVLIEKGSPVWTGAFGFADSARRHPMTTDAVFRVESISKPVTAWAAMRLSETSNLDLDAPATHCLRRWQPPEGTPSFTARQLLSHTAGVALGDFTIRLEPTAPRPDLTTHLAEDFAMTAAPGALFAYSDTGYNLLELMIEDCTGENFADFMKREILDPLGMTASDYDWPGSGMPQGHDLRGHPVPAYVYPGRGSGGLHATAGDIARFAAAGMAGSDQGVLSSEGIETLHQPAVSVRGLFGLAADGYGLGHFTETLSDGRAAVWHGGQGHGWLTHLHMVPETGAGIVILSNSQRAWPLFAVILRAWSESLGVAPVGMAHILWAETAARIAIPLLLVAGALALSSALRRRTRGSSVRLLAGSAAVVLIAWPVWAASQDYLFIFSILPGLWTWLAAAMGLTGLALGVFALARGPRR